MRIISFCADGIKQAAEAGFYEWLAGQDAEIVCIQGLKAEERNLRDDVYFPEGYFHYFFDSPTGENGVAIYCRQMPKAIMTGLGFGELDIQARYIQADYETVSFGSLLAPFAEQGDVAALENKAAFFDDFQAHLDKIRNKRRHFVFAGNWNIVHKKRDIEDAEAHQDMPGFLVDERRWMDDVTGRLGYCDAFRQVNLDDDEFSWIKEGQSPCRVDYQVVSNELKDLVEYAVIYKAKRFGEHAPVIVDYDFEL